MSLRMANLDFLEMIRLDVLVIVPETMDRNELVMTDLVHEEMCLQKVPNVTVSKQRGQL